MHPAPESPNGDQPAAPGESALETPGPPPAASQLLASGSAPVGSSGTIGPSAAADSDAQAADSDKTAQSVAADPEAHLDTPVATPASDDAADAVTDEPDAADGESTADADADQVAHPDGVDTTASTDADTNTDGHAAPSHEARAGTDAATDGPDAVADEGPTVYAVPGDQAHADRDDPTPPPGDAATVGTGRDVETGADSGEPAVGDSTTVDADSAGGEPNGAAEARADVVADEGPAIALSGDGDEGAGVDEEAGLAADSTSGGGQDPGSAADQDAQAGVVGGGPVAADRSDVAATDDAAADDGPAVYALSVDDEDRAGTAGDDEPSAQAGTDGRAVPGGDAASDPDVGGSRPQAAGGDAAADPGTGGEGDGPTGLEAQAREAEHAAAQSEAVAAAKTEESEDAPGPTGDRPAVDAPSSDDQSGADDIATGAPGTPADGRGGEPTRLEAEARAAEDAGARSEATPAAPAEGSTMEHAGAVPAEEPEPVTATPTLADLGHATADGGAEAGPLRPADVAKTRIAVWSVETAQTLRGEWHEVTARFVDEPEAALEEAKALVTRAVQQLAETLLAEQVDLDPRRQSAIPDTEAMRVAMRRYRDFLDRVLAL